MELLFTLVTNTNIQYRYKVHKLHNIVISLYLFYNVRNQGKVQSNGLHRHREM